ncbi:MAG: linear amide C-N hydrolase [Candidatus Aminicenantes bacterium]|nr:MAG: linear amide C-N hydrolase [Candidatus Aminicenantes bacterium]
MLFLRRIIIAAGILVCLFVCAPGSAAADLQYQETVVAGSTGDFMLVRHIMIKGCNYEIGKKIAEIAKKDQGQVLPVSDTLKNRVRRLYIKKNYPTFYERMRGVAAGFGLDVEDDRYDFTALSQGPANPGCSVVYYPPGVTENKHGILSRNYDFTTGNFQGRRLKPGQLSATARPIVFEIYPDNGYPSLFICAYDMLGGVIDGINWEGLTVAILAEEESMQKGAYEPGANEVGLHELASMRYLLDHCKNVKEAKEAMLALKHYYSFIPCHYIIADKNGDSFIFEFSPARNKTFIIDGKGPQCITNHMVALHPHPHQLPVGNSFERFRTLYNATTSEKTFSLSRIKSINASVAVHPYFPADPGQAPGRTLWHALYDTHEKSLSVKFYLGETTDSGDNKKIRLRYSAYLHFQLKNMKER